MTTWRVSVVDLETGEVDFPYARMGLRVWSRRELCRKGVWTEGAWESRTFIGSLEAGNRSLQEWLGVVRGHWAGVENRNHWRKDACLFEDKTRSRKESIVCNLMLLRNVVLWYREKEGGQHETLPAFIETVAANPRLAFRMVTRP